MNVKDRYHRGLPTPELVRIDTLHKGEHFTPAYGENLIAENRSLKDQGQVYFATNVKGESRLFAACALVLPGWHEKGWLQ